MNTESPVDDGYGRVALALVRADDSLQGDCVGMDSQHENDRITIDHKVSKVPAEGASCRGTAAVGNGEQNMKRRLGLPIFGGVVFVQHVRAGFIVLP